MSIIGGIIVGLIAAYYSFSYIFDDYEDFKECAWFWFTPDFISFFRDEYLKDLKAEIRLWVWAIISIAPGCVVYFLLTLLLKN